MNSQSELEGLGFVGADTMTLVTDVAESERDVRLFVNTCARQVYVEWFKMEVDLQVNCTYVILFTDQCCTIIDFGAERNSSKMSQMNRNGFVIIVLCDSNVPAVGNWDGKL